MANKLNHTNIIAAWNRIDTIEQAKSTAVRKVTAAYELVAETLVEAAMAEGIKTASATDLFLATIKAELLGGAKEETAFTRRWERAVKAAFTTEGSPLMVSAKRKAAQAQAKASHYKQAADRLEKAGVEQDAARKAVLAAIAEDKTGVLTLNLLKVVEGFRNEVAVIRIQPEQGEKPTPVAKGKVIAKIAPVKAVAKRKTA